MFYLDLKKLESRNTSLDIIRIVAVFTVISVHFFLNNGFYSETVSGTNMYIMCLMRTLFSICVPMFLVLTGYLMCKKTLCKKFYLGITKTLTTFVLASIACMIFKAVHNNTSLTFKSLLLGTLDFTGANYSWYVEMYIGLFLLIPFLNIIYNKLESKKHKQILLLTMIALTILPSLFNIYNFDSAQWWSNPTTSDTFAKLIPSWWMGFYPVTYYFAGCYIREYGIHLKTSSLLVLLVVCTFLFGSFNFYRSYGTTFKSGTYVFWYGFEPFILTIIVFVLLSRIKTDNLPVIPKWILWKVSDLALGIYLLSYIFDTVFYPKLNTAVNPMTQRLGYYFILVPFVFICSLLSSAVISVIEKIIRYVFTEIYSYVKLKKDVINKIFLQDRIFIILFAGAIILAFWKCFYGFGGNDEAFYLTVSHRLSLGDSLIRDEWHLSQLSGFLLLPFVSIFRFITQSTEGIMITARIVYIILHAALCAFIYLRLRKYGFMSVVASVLYFLFTPYDIMALSYNTMGLDLIVLTGIIMATSDYAKKLPLIISGIAFAAAVLCCPYLSAAYVIFGICAIVHIILKRSNFTKNIFADDLFSGKTFLWFTVGIASLAAVFLIYLFSSISISDITANLPNMLTDPEHPQTAITSKLLSYFTSVLNCQVQFKYAIISYALVILAMILDINRKNHRLIYLMISSGIVIFTYVLFVPNLTSVYYNAIMFPMIFLGITSYILLDRKPKRLLICLFALGILYSVAISLSSNQYFYVISMAISASNIASIIFLGVLLKEMQERSDTVQYEKVLKRAGFVLIAFVIFLQGAFQIKIKVSHCFWESGSPSTLNYQIEDGPAKGIFTDVSKFNEYENIYNDLQYYKNIDRKNILFMTEKTWCYLAVNDFTYGAYSAWLSGENNTSIERLKIYYSLNPEKIPEYIYIPKVAKWDLTNIYNDAQKNGYTINENAISYKLTKTH